MSRVKDMLSRVGFLMEETMTGSHSFVHDIGPAEHVPMEHFMEFNILWGPSSVLEWLKHPHFMTHPVAGDVTVDNLVKQAPCYGVMKLDYFGKNTIRYVFYFSDRFGTEYRYIGEKVDIKPWNLLTSHTTCFGTVHEVNTGRLVSRSVTHFKLSTAWKFLTSFRLT